MSGIVGYQGSKSGTVGAFRGEYKLAWKADCRSSFAGGGANIDFNGTNGLVKGMFTHFKIVGEGFQNSNGTACALGIRWSGVTGATTGYAVQGYYGTRWSGHHDDGTTLTKAAESNGNHGRVCYMNAPGTTYGVNGMEIIMSNPGVGDGTSGTNQTSAMCRTTGYVHSTSSNGHGGVTAYIMNNNTTNATTSSSNGQISAITLHITSGNWAKGTIYFFGMVK